MRGRTARIAAAMLTAVLLVLSFPAPDLGWLAWIALVPLLLAVADARPRQALVAGFVAGVAASCGIHWFLTGVPGFGPGQAIVLALYVALYPAAWACGVSALVRSGTPLALAAPALWVILEFAKGHAGFLALPWATLAHTQHENLAILQVASLAGEAGVSFLVVLGNVAVTELARGGGARRALWLAAPVLVAHLYGGIVLGRGPESAERSIAVVQPSLEIAERATAEGREAGLARLERLTVEAAAAKPALIAWPETAVGDLTKDHALLERIRSLVDSTGVPLLLGSARVDKFTRRDGATISTAARIYNAAVLFEPGRPLAEPYRKTRLMPFAEYLPLESLVHWPTWLVPRSYAVTPGDWRGPFVLQDGLRVGALICWENLFAEHARRTVAEGASVLVQLTNDAWFGRSAAARQHNLASVLRAVETRTPVVVASNTGPSQVVDAYGRVVAELPELGRAGVTTAVVSLGAGPTLYGRVGDLLVVLVALALWIQPRIRLAAWGGRRSAPMTEVE